MRLLSILGVAGGLLLAVGCENEDPCDRYVDYMCDCHDGQDGVDCADLQGTLEGADQDVQDQCALDLQDQQDQDDEEGVSCDS